MTTSLDGFVADRSGSASRLYPDLAALQGTGYMNAAIEETGAVLMGKRTFEMGDHDSYVGNYEFQVPIFVLTHEPPRVTPKQDARLTFTFVTDGVVSAIAKATAAAGDRSVQVVGGANVIHQMLRAGLVDEIHVDVMGRRGQNEPQIPRQEIEGASSSSTVRTSRRYESYRERRRPNSLNQATSAC